MIYYIIMSNGIPVDVRTERHSAMEVMKQWETVNRPAEVIPVIPMPLEEQPISATFPDAGEFVDEDPTSPF